MKQTLLCFLLLCSMSGIAQVRQDFEFVDYLIGNGMKKDAIQYTNRFDTLIPTLPQAQQDSLFFLKGWAYYSSKKLTEAADYFMQMTDSLSPLKPKATYFASLCLAQSGQYTTADSLLSTLNDTTEVFAFEKAGMALLNRNLDEYTRQAQHFSFADYRLSSAQQELQHAYTDIASLKPKKKWIAGAASALVPGLGKIYTRHIGEGISSFLMVGSFAAITAENWYKRGFTNWKTILFGSIGTIFYIGNIYGSVASVNVYYDEFNEKQNARILYHIHIPLRSIFE